MTKAPLARPVQTHKAIGHPVRETAFVSAIVLQASADGGHGAE